MTIPKKPPAHLAPSQGLPTTMPMPLDEAAVSAPAPARSLSLGSAGLLLGLGAVLLAAGCAYLLSLFLPTGPVWAAVAAGLGVAAAGVPLAWVMATLAREAAGADPSRGSVGTAPSAGMPRHLFMDLSGREFARARRYGTGAALLLVDVDRHARLCESRGPNAGEAVLAALLDSTAPTLRTADVLTRFSSTQMAVFLAHADATGALDVAERIRERAEQLEVPFAGSGQPLRFTVTAGVAHLRPAHLNLAALVEDAEEAVMAARSAGGNCVRAAPVEAGRARSAGLWRDERRARPKHGGTN